MKSKNISAGQTYSYLALRKAVGWMGILLPFILMFGFFLIFKGDIPLFDISMYYYTGMLDVFVGALCAIGLFLFFYIGISWLTKGGTFYPDKKDEIKSP